MVPYEQSLQRAMGEVRDSRHFDVVYEQLGPGGPGKDPTGIFELMAEDGFPLAPRLKESYFPYRYMALEWRTANPGTALVGEFQIYNIDAGTEECLRPLEDFSRDHRGKELLSQLRIFDDLSRTGHGRLATLRLYPGVTNPEIWFLDKSHPAVRLDLDYRAYLDNLILTKGTLGWQYLFADVDREYIHVLEDVATMLRIFPGLFPDYDYAPLISRLEARL
ncbi:hypothetical protein ACQEU6_07085 [Spirillospora sp. CA-108201]